MGKLSKGEKDLLVSYEQGEWKSIKNIKREAKRYRQMASATFRKNRRVNIRISDRDLDELKRKAVEEGIPYQTLIASVLHKYVSGTLIRKAA